MLQELNDTNGASDFTHKCYMECLNKFQNEFLYAAEFGVPYGGAVAKIGKEWKGRGKVWGFDTFEGHPKLLRYVCQYTKELENILNSEAEATSCMDRWYKNADYGTEKLKYEYIQSKLDEENLDNVVLVKGLVDEKTNLDFIPKLHYAFIDFDFPIAQWNVWNLIKNKVTSGGYLCLHDMIPQNHVYGNYQIYQNMLSENLYDVIQEIPSSYLCILRRK